MSQNPEHVGINVTVPIMPKNGSRGTSPQMDRRGIPVRSPYSNQSTTSSVGSFGSHDSESPLMFHDDSNYINVENELRPDNVLDSCSTMSLNFDAMVKAKSNLTQRPIDATVDATKDSYGRGYSQIKNNNMTENGGKPPPFHRQFVVEHLASFPQDVSRGYNESLAKLKIIESDGKLWKQEMNMNISAENLVMTNGETQEVIEEYPLEHIDFCKAAQDDLIENLLVLATKPSKKVGAHHLFQCRPGDPEKIVNTINHVRGEVNGNGVITTQAGVAPNGRTYSSASDSSQPETKTQYNLQQKHRVAQVVQAFQSGIEEKIMTSQADEKPAMNGGHVITQLQDAKITRDVEILNKCIEEIENFVVMLKRINEARKQLQQKKRKSKKKVENILILQSQPPPEHRILDIYQKFKHAFNLLGKLQPHISDPSAPELIHYLFIPLGIIVKVTGIEKARSVLDPLLTMTCVDLLKHCLDSKEYHFWTSLGPNWTLTKNSEQFKNHYIPPYVPVFADGWVPPEVIVNEKHEAAAKSTAAIVARMQRKSSAEVANSNPTVIQAAMKFQDPIVDKRRPNDDPNMRRSNSSNGIIQVNTADIHQPPRNNSFSTSPVEKQLIGIVVYDYLAHNNKELTIRSGEHVIILENSRRWWLVQNDHGEQGYVPSTVLEIPTSEAHDMVDAVPERYLQNNNKQTVMTNGNHRTSQPPSPLDSNQNYVNGNDIPTPPPQQTIQRFTPPPITKCTPPPAVTRYTPPQPQNVTRFTPPPTHFSQIKMPPSPQPVNKITPVVISVKIPQNPDITSEQTQQRTKISVSPVPTRRNPGATQTSITNEQRTFVKVPTTSIVIKKKESTSSESSASPVMQDDGRIGQAVLRTVTVDKVNSRNSSPKNESPRTPPVLTIPPPPAPPPPPVMSGPNVQPKPKFTREQSKEPVKPRVEPKPNLQDELRHRLSLVHQGPIPDPMANIDSVDVFIPLYKSSTADDVSRWLRKLGFSEVTIETLKGKTAQDLFRMDKDTIYELLGDVEGKQLYDELLVQNGAINHKNTLTEFQKALVHRVKKRETEINRAQNKSPAANVNGQFPEPPPPLEVVNGDTAKYEEQTSTIKRQKEELQKLKAEQSKREPNSATFTSFQAEDS